MPAYRQGSRAAYQVRVTSSAVSIHLIVCSVCVRMREVVRTHPIQRRSIPLNDWLAPSLRGDDPAGVLGYVQLDRLRGSGRVLRYRVVRTVSFVRSVSSIMELFSVF